MNLIENKLKQKRKRTEIHSILSWNPQLNSILTLWWHQHFQTYFRSIRTLLYLWTPLKQPLATLSPWFSSLVYTVVPSTRPTVPNLILCITAHPCNCSLVASQGFSHPKLKLHINLLNPGRQNIKVQEDQRQTTYLLFFFPWKRHLNFQWLRMKHPFILSH